MWKRLLVLDKFENERKLEFVPLSFGKMGSRSTVDLQNFETTKTYCEEMKKTWNLPRCSLQTKGVNRCLRKVRKPVYSSYLILILHWCN